MVRAGRRLSVSESAPAPRVLQQAWPSAMRASPIVAAAAGRTPHSDPHPSMPADRVPAMFPMTGGHPIQMPSAAGRIGSPLGRPMRNVIERTAPAVAKLDLPTGPAELLEAVRKPLGHHLGGELEMRLGGGTALAARWRHRYSTDVDLFVHPADYEGLFKSEQWFRADLELHARSARNIVIEPGFARIVLPDGGEISVSTSPSLTAHPVSGDTVRGTSVPLETTAEILAKKLRIA